MLKAFARRVDFCESKYHTNSLIGYTAVISLYPVNWHDWLAFSVAAVQLYLMLFLAVANNSNSNIPPELGQFDLCFTSVWRSVCVRWSPPLPVWPYFSTIAHSWAIFATKLQLAARYFELRERVCIAHAFYNLFHSQVLSGFFSITSFIECVE